MVASGTSSCVRLILGYFKTVPDIEAMIVCKSFAYDSNTSVARVATGFFLPISLANLGDRSLMAITITTRKMVYVGKANCNHVFQ